MAKEKNRSHFLFSFFAVTLKCAKVAPVTYVKPDNVPPAQLPKHLRYTPFKCFEMCFPIYAYSHSKKYTLQLDILGQIKLVQSFIMTDKAESVFEWNAQSFLVTNFFFIFCNAFTKTGML